MTNVEEKFRIEQEPAFHEPPHGSFPFTMADVKSKRRIVDTAAIIEELEAERDRLDSALAALQGSTTVVPGAGQQAPRPSMVENGT
jgi:hypothetical protein